MDKAKTKEVWVYQRDYDIKAMLKAKGYPRLKVRIDREFWTAWLALSQTLKALNEAIRDCNSLNSKDLRGAGLKKDLTPRRAGVALIIM